MAQRQLGGGRLGGKLSAYVPRGAQYDYQPPSVFARYKVLSALFVLLSVSLFGWWAVRMRQSRAAIPRPTALHPPAQVQPQSQPVYIEPLAPK